MPSVQLQKKRGCENSSFSWAGYPTLRLGYSCFLSFLLLLHKPHIWIGSVFECMSEFAAALYYLLHLATKKPEETSDSKDSVFLRATSGMVKQISCSDCALGYNLDTQYFLAVFSLQFCILQMICCLSKFQTLIAFLRASAPVFISSEITYFISL